MIDQNSARALLIYLQRAVPVVPTTAAEWMGASSAITVLEQVANGQLELEAKQDAKKPDAPHAVRN